jgi:predicted Zn-dependent protease
VRSTLGVTAWHAGTFCDLALSTLERPAGHRASSFRARYDRARKRRFWSRWPTTTRAECHRARDPVDVEPGRYDVVLAPTAVADLLDWFGAIGFGSEAFDDGRSFAQGRFGEAITGPAVTLTDDGTMAHGLGVPLPIDAEGQPRQRVTLISRTAWRAAASGTTRAPPPRLRADGARARRRPLLHGRRRARRT